MDTALYDELWEVEQKHWWFQGRRHIVWALARQHLPAVAARRLKICEVGCGTGGNLAAVADRHDVVGVDCAPEALRYARQRLGDRVRSGILPDNLGLPPNRFDVVLMTDVLEHVEDDVRSAEAALQLVRPGGVLIATVPAYQWLYSPRDAHHHHFRRYSRRRFHGLWRLPDAELLVLSHYNTVLFPAAAAARLASKLLPQTAKPRDVRIPPGPLNRLLAKVFQSEGPFLSRFRLPFGLSLIAVVRKREATAIARTAA